MKIDTLDLRNFRSAENLSIDFDDKFNVLVGINGAGKTTILEGIAISLSWLVGRIQNSKARGSHIAHSDIRYHAPNASLSLKVSEDNQTFQWELIKTAQGHESEEKSNLTDSSQLASLYRDRLREREDLPVIAYYPVSRTVENITPKVSSYDNPFVFEIYENALSGGSNYQSFFEWFRIQDDILNEERSSRSLWLKSHKKILEDKSNFLLQSLEALLLNKHHADNLFFLSEIEDLKSSETLFLDSEYYIYRLLRIFDICDFQYGHVFEENLVNEILSLIMNTNNNLWKPSYKVMKYEQLTEGFFYSFQEALKFSKNIPLLVFVWDMFIFVHNLTLWWMNDNGRQKILSELTDYKVKVADIGNERDLKFDKVIVTIQSIMNQEIERQQQIIRNNGNELKIVAHAIEEFVPEYNNLRVKRTPKPHMLINKNGEEFNLEHLSDGEKNLITLVGDIARRLAIANPNLSNPLDGDGVILIDEIDLHLHPSWQRLMVPKFQEIFPNCQFIVTTHSPQVISHVQPNSLLLLTNQDNNLFCNTATESYGKNIDRVLEDILKVKTRPDNVIDLFTQLDEMIENLEIDQAKSLIEELSALIVGGDPELVRARSILKRKQILGK